jgi:hypothetical protein
LLLTCRALLCLSFAPQIYLRGSEIQLEVFQELPSAQREVAGLLGAHVYPGKQLAPFADNQPMLITTLLLNAAACHLRDPTINADPSLAPHNALHLAVAAIVLQPRYGQAYHRTACAMAALGTDIDLGSAYAIMRYAAQLESRPAAELLAQLPPLPPGAVELPFGDDMSGALHEVMKRLFTWPLLMHARAPPGQDFLLQLPGGLGELHPSRVYDVMAALDAEMHVTMAMDAKECGNAAFAAGDTAHALREYNAGIDCLRVLTAEHLRCIVKAAGDAKMDPDAIDPATAVAIAQYMLAPVVYVGMQPYKGPKYAAVCWNIASCFCKACPPLLPSQGLPGCRDLPALVRAFWSQLTAKFMEPVGGAEGLLANDGAWTHPEPVRLCSSGFQPLAPF